MRRSPFQKAFYFSGCGKGRTVLVELGNNGVKVGCRGARREEPHCSDCEMSSSLSPDRYPRLHPLRAFCLPPLNGCGARACLPACLPGKPALEPPSPGGGGGEAG